MSKEDKNKKISLLSIEMNKNYGVTGKNIIKNQILKTSSAESNLNSILSNNKLSNKDKIDKINIEYGVNILESDLSNNDISKIILQKTENSKIVSFDTNIIANNARWESSTFKDMNYHLNKLVSSDTEVKVDDNDFFYYVSKKGKNDKSIGSFLVKDILNANEVVSVDASSHDYITTRGTKEDVVIKVDFKLLDNEYNYGYVIDNGLPIVQGKYKSNVTVDFGHELIHSYDIIHDIDDDRSVLQVYKEKNKNIKLDKTEYKVI